MSKTEQLFRLVESLNGPLSFCGADKTIAFHFKDEHTSQLTYEDSRPLYRPELYMLYGALRDHLDDTYPECLVNFTFEPADMDTEFLISSWFDIVTRRALVT